MSFEEIGERLGLTGQAVRVIYQGALKKLEENGSRELLRYHYDN